MTAEQVDRDFSGVDCYSRELTGDRFARCRFAQRVVSRVRSLPALPLRCASLFGVTLGGGKLTGSVFEGSCVLRPLTVEGGDWSYVSPVGRTAGLDLSGVRLTEVDFTLADLRGTVLRGCDLEHARFDGAQTAGADVRDAVLAAVDL